LGIYSATHPNSLGDKTTTLAAFVLFAVPVVWAATMAIVFICGGDFLYLFPPGGLNSIDYAPDWPLWERIKDQFWHLFLPVVLLSYDGFAGLSRYMRASMLEVLGQDYVQVARAKGLQERVVIMKHVLRNSLIPLVTILASILPMPAVSLPDYLLSRAGTAPARIGAVLTIRPCTPFLPVRRR
jgi:peptide/nickel transport system permease protein